MQKVRNFIRKVMSLDTRVPPVVKGPVVEVSKGNIHIRYVGSPNVFRLTANFSPSALSKTEGPEIKLSWDAFDSHKWDFTVGEVLHYNGKLWQMPPEVQRTIDWLIDQVEQEERRRWLLSKISIMTREVKAFRTGGCMHTILKKIDEFELEKDNGSRANDVPPLEDAAWQEIPQ